ncbi:MAG TPA: acetyl-CoA carboxylase biotin carboxyl carrier protein [Pyrinomonadaceae bacterium]|nr:acetyl-CoA carboxylase biotin carboxyl carrier protein [Pyrinomonadaceae bacterium]
MSDNTGSAKATEDKVADKKDKGASEPSFNMDELQALAALVNEHGFTDFEFENENIRVRLSKQTAAVMAAPVQQMAAPQAAPAAPAAAEAAPADPDAGLHKIVSPIVGTFYRASGPDKEPYVKEGSNVSADTTVCIVEAMKLMNEIQAEVAGEIVKVYVENGQPVEYGQPLFGVKK